VRVDVRVIAATHRPLEELIASGKFREDLYYRLNVVTLWLPPLRDRTDDLHELAASFLKRASTHLGKDVHDIDDAALVALLRYPWPGNIRELENVIERAVVLAEEDVIRLEDLPADIHGAAFEVAKAPADDEFGLRRRPRTAEPRTNGNWRAREAQEERRRLIGALQQCGGNKARAAKLLGLPRSTFFSKLKKHALAD
jgi:DNA-binding NtrC family response regulator